MVLGFETLNLISNAAQEKLTMDAHRSQGVTGSFVYYGRGRHEDSRGFYEERRPSLSLSPSLPLSLSPSPSLSLLLSLSISLSPYIYTYLPISLSFSLSVYIYIFPKQCLHN